MNDKKNLKFPYPVLNDKRELKSILEILEEKEEDLSRKLEQTKKSYKQNDKSDEKRKEKLKNLYKNYKSQLNKIEKQLDYVRIQIKLKKILKNREKKKDKEYKQEQYNEYKQELEELSKFMRDANKTWLAENKESTPTVVQPSLSPQQKESMIVIGPTQPPPGYQYPIFFDEEKLNTMISQNVAVAIAQTAAAAHAAAALAAAAYNPPPPPLPSSTQSSYEISTKNLNKNEIAHAKVKFDKFKSKISELIGSKESSLKIKFTDSFKSLMNAYDTKEDNDVQVINDENISDDDSSDTEVDVVFKSSEKMLNFVLPSTKSCRLQCVLTSSNDKYLNYPHEIQMTSSKTKPLISTQISSNSMILMGSQNLMSKKMNLSDFLYKNK